MEKTETQKIKKKQIQFSETVEILPTYNNEVSKQDKNQYWYLRGGCE